MRIHVETATGGALSTYEVADGDDITLVLNDGDHTWQRNLDDYTERCPACHLRYDFDNGLRPSLEQRGRAS